MASTKQLLVFLLLLFLVMPVKVCIPQQAESEFSQTEEVSSATSKAEKKKEKKILEINQKFLFSLAIDLTSVILIICLIYYPNYRKLDYIFTFIMFNIMIFLLTFVLKYVKLSVGAAFGLFAVFSMLRYRTAGISMKDMTYLFIFIAMGVISAIQLEYYELGVLHAIILLGTFALDKNFLIKREFSKSIQYENIEMIKPEHYDGLMEDLRNRTGLKIHRLTIGKINFLKDTANIRIYYYE
jgi:hypothetical protein